MTTRVRGLTRLTLEEMPRVCHECVWWQSKTGRRANKDRWTERVEDDTVGRQADNLSAVPLQPEQR